MSSADKKSQTLKLTKSELEFLNSQNLDETDVYDCQGRSIASCKDKAKALGKRILLYGNCKKANHRLKSRHGHCVQCNTSILAYQERKSAKGTVYVMYSATTRLTKVGFSARIEVREEKIRYDAVAGATDWRLVFYVKVANAGELEQEVQRRLKAFIKKSDYVKDGQKQTSRECFSCKPLYAVDLSPKAVPSICRVLAS